MSTARTLSGIGDTGARWAIDIPEQWNGTLCLFSPGYGEADGHGPVHSAGDTVTQETLLALGYAVAGTAFSTPGWAVESALRDQLATIAAFTNEVEAPLRIIAWGHSMGGLITAGLAQEHADAIDGAVALCASVAGSIPMLNQSLDASFAFTQLCCPDDPIELVNVSGDDWSRLSRATALVEEAQRTPQGRARVALASAFAQLPTWTVNNLRGAVPQPSEPSPGDLVAMQSNQASVFSLAAFSPRADLEERAGGNFSWNTGIDYREQLELSGQRAFVEALYEVADDGAGGGAGASLDADLARLSAAPRIDADPRAVAYMEANLTPTGAIGVPVLTVHITGDFAPTVTQAAAYASIVRDAGNENLLRQVYVHAAGHCAAFSAAEIAASIQAMDQRLTNGTWPELESHALNAAAHGIANARWPRLKSPQFADFVPHTFVRPHPLSARASVPTAARVATRLENTPSEEGAP